MKNILGTLAFVGICLVIYTKYKESKVSAKDIKIVN